MLNTFGKINAEFEAYKTDLQEDDIAVVQYNFTRWEKAIAKIRGVRVEEGNIGLSFILDSTANGILGTSRFDATGFIIGHPSQGKIGATDANLLGDWKDVPSVVTQINANSTWYEPLFNVEYLNEAATTATIDYDAHTATGVAVSTVYLQTDDIYKYASNNINRVKVSGCLEVTPGSSTITWESSTDEGDSWETLTFGSWTSVTSGDSLRIRAVLYAPAGDLPIIAAGTANQIKIEYTNV